MNVVAFHGDFASGRILKRDMGNPVWVNRYHDGLDLYKASKSLISRTDNVLIGYSRGGSLIGHLSICQDIRIKAAVLYESPLIGIDEVGGTFPVLWIKNAYRRKGWRKKEMDDTEKLWRATHSVDTLVGQGSHVRFTMGCPPIGHAWDQQLNPAIEHWIDTHG